jgi:hypothetical protein
MTASMGPSARLVSYSGEGHGQILNSTCVTDIEAAVIATLTLPAPGTTCDPDPDVARPDFWDSLPVPAGVGPTLDDPSVDLLLGITPSQIYAESRVLTGDASAVATAYSTALQGLGFFVAPPVTDQIEGAMLVGALAPDGTEIFILIMPPAAFAANEDLADLANAVEAGQGIVVIGAFAPS